MIPQTLSELARYPQFLNWVPVPKPNGKIDKIPISPYTHEICDAHDVAQHVTYEQAAASGMPVAFVFRDTDPFFFVDIDGCTDASGQWSQTAQYICGLFPGCAMEVSQSGHGLHIFGTLPPGAPEHSTVSDTLGTQFYTSKRFVALTFSGLQGDIRTIPDPQTYHHFITTYFPRRASADPSEWTTEPRGDWLGPDDNDELIKRMRRSKSARSLAGGGVTLAQLLDADEDALSTVYPDSGGQGRAFDWSKADAALCAQLAFWTGCNCERMREIWGSVPLGQRDKFLGRDDYVRDTILKACGMCKKVYKQRVPLPDPTPVLPSTQQTKPAAAVPEVPPIREGFQLVDATLQTDYFKGCVYVTDIHKAYIPGGELLKPKQFRVRYGGYVFSMDSIGDKTSNNAWEAFTESKALTPPKVSGVCFRPDEEPGKIIPRDGQTFINIYEPINTPCAPGDVGPFCDLLNRMLPNEGDRNILLAYMAAVVQYPGHKFYWVPLLQGVQGNGKTFLSDCLMEAVGRRYYHQIEASDISNKFNAWVTNTIFASIEEIHIRRNDVDAMNVLKKLITNRVVPLQGKGRDQEIGENCVKLMLNSNFRDAVAKSEDDRRFAVFYTAQQEFRDIAASGMGGAYFPNLWTWAKDGGGFAAINHYLRTYQIPDALNPATNCHRAPATSTTAEAIEYCKGPIEQRIIEAIEEGRPGFCGGWVSSVALDRLIKDNHVKVALNKRGPMMRQLGYVVHPHLPNGRVNSLIPLEMGKPRLYIQEGHIGLNRTDAREIAQMYCKAQDYPIGEVAASGNAGMGCSK